ncbi:hypothetical protein C8R44DRAFT_836058 [Mycena epipterygia]|nr:hypothetical protein C8R44DRAFT_836058 [Mycena epipterygia]
MYNIMMVAKARATRVTHLFSEKTKKELPDEFTAVSQRYSKGNVAIFAQDVASLRTILPPPKQEIHEAMCTLFIGPSVAPTRENIRELSPVVVSKTRVECMINFLLSKNAFYVGADVTFSPENLAALFADGEGDVGIPNAVEVCCLPDSTLEADGYADRGAAVASQPHTDIVMEAVGYTVGERSPKNLREMKALAVAWCLDKQNFIKMQSGSKFLSDRDPGLLTDSQRISFAQQVKNLLLQSDGTFQRDPNFAYVCWNIMQKAEKWELNPEAKASNKAEKKALRTLGCLKLLAKDLKGSSGYKQCRRNEIRALMKKMATPALFMTLNPADILDPLLGAMGGIDPEDWAKMDGFQRKLFVAKNPAPAAQFFDEMQRLLRHGGGPRARNVALSHARLD